MFGYAIKVGEVAIVLFRNDRVSPKVHFNENEDLFRKVFDDKSFENIKNRMIGIDNSDIVMFGLTNGFGSIRKVNKQ